MKKILVVVLILSLVLAIFSGCAKTEPVVEQSQSSENEIENSDNQTKEEDKKIGTMADTVEIDEATVTFVDAVGDKVTINKNPQKVICLYNSYLDLWYSSGGEVIGRISSRTKVPEAAMDAEIVGAMTDPNIEKIISMQPDLVIIRPDKTGQKDLIPIFKENNIPYLAAEYNNFEEYLYTTRVFTALNERDDLYETNGMGLKEKIDEIIEKVPKDEKPTVLLMFATSRNVSVRLPNTSVGEMLQDLGAENIAYDTKLSEEEMQVFSLEKIVERDPDFIFVQTMGDIEQIKERLIKDVETNPAWNTLTAVKEGRYILLPKELYLYKANTRYAEAYEGLAKDLYPEVFE